MPIFAIMALGYFAGWIRDVDNHHVAELNALVMDFALPASLFVATASTSGAVLSEQWPLLVVFTVSMLALYALSDRMQCSPVRFGIGRTRRAHHCPAELCSGRPTADRRDARSGRHDLLALSIATGSIVLSPLTLATLETNKGSAGRKGFWRGPARRWPLPVPADRTSPRHSVLPGRGSRSRRLSAVPFS